MTINHSYYILESGHTARLDITAEEKKEMQATYPKLTRQQKAAIDEACDLVPEEIERPLSLFLYRQARFTD